MHDKDIKPFNEQMQRHGLWIWHSANGDLFLKSHYINDRAHGYLYYRPLFRYDGEIREEHEYHAR